MVVSVLRGCCTCPRSNLGRSDHESPKWSARLLCMAAQCMKIKSYLICLSVFLKAVLFIFDTPSLVVKVLAMEKLTLTVCEFHINSGVL